jgi:hypothetical protein
MSAIQKFGRFARKPLADKWAAINATFFHAERRRLHRALIGPHAPPRVLRSGGKMYIAYRPDSDCIFNQHPEIVQLSEQWITDNLINNAGDLPRLYALLLNIKQVLNDGIGGDMAELGVYRGNSAALLAYYARIHRRRVLLFDTFQGFDRRDLVGGDESRPIEFDDTSLARVRDLVGKRDVRFVQGRFPQSIAPDLFMSRFCLAHIDCDLYEPAKAALEFFYPRISPGGLLIVHDYGNPHWDGMKRAVDEYCCEIPEKPIIVGDKSGTAMIRKCMKT